MYSITAWWVLSHNESGLADTMQCLIPTLLFKDNLDIHIFCHIFLYFLLKECRIKNTWKPQSSHVRLWTHQTVFITSMYPDLQAMAECFVFRNESCEVSTYPKHLKRDMWPDMKDKKLTTCFESMLHENMQLHEHSHSNSQYTRHGSNMANSKWSQWVSEQSAIKKQKIV